MLKRILYRILIVLIIILGSASTFIILSGNQYLFFTLRHTVFKGRLGPSIDEYQIYHNREVKNDESRWSWYENTKNRGLLDEELKYHQGYGTAAYLVIKHDSIIYEYYDEDHNKTSVINPWSMSKSVVSLLIGIAIDEELIKDEYELLESYFPQYSGSGINIYHLLTMSSGINFDEDYLDPFAHSAKSLYGSDIVALNDDYIPVKTPGITFDYQGGNTILLAMILKQVTGMNLSEYASKKLWTKIDAEHPAYWGLDHENGMERAFCCFNTNARDFARIGRLMINRGYWNGKQILSESYIKKATSAADIIGEDGGKNKVYGYQWWVLQMQEYQGYYARGIQGQYLVILPEEDLIVVRFGDARPSTRIEGHVTDMLYYIDMARRLVRE